MRADLPRLQAFVDQLPAGLPAAMEFRHASWFADAVYDCLHEHNMAICHADDEEHDFPFVPTADWGYLRLRRSSYSAAELEAWAHRCGEAGFEHSHVFFKHEDEGAGPKLALAFQALVGAEADVRRA